MDCLSGMAKLHLEPSELAAFDPLGYSDTELGYEKLRNVVVLRSGFCLKNGLLLNRSMYRHRHLYPRFIFHAYASWLKRKTLRLDPDKLYAVVHNVWSGGYYEWITEALARLRPIQNFLDKATVLVCSATPTNQVVEESLKCFGVTDFEYFPPEANLFAHNLLLPDNPPRHTEVSRGSVDFIRENVLAAVPDIRDSSRSSRKIFISRARARARKIANEADVLQCLAAHGYERVFMEEHTFADQVRLMQGAEFVISQHGAGLTNIMFMRPETRVLELFREGTGNQNWGRGLKSAKLNPSYPRLAAKVGVNYYCLLCAASDCNAHVSVGDLTVDVDELGRKIALMEGAAAKPD